ncbi:MULTISPECIES: GlxA family transcriptional regulator [unclassified Sphingobium]|uniref:GlxA family transcriptional regulator n=1 Tax=unclassified Sphingobium TaxID=2611147 RepID=UPI000D1658F1|nr:MULTISPECIES: helix-turn-helix domain-containing protein [unclassified Sphingobium]MBG6120015.1 transcriptional regulator GlxA family with amidase domain [Sphingobium sp. JAI105]PSO12927.1 transcriptional regulator [Sphingobium sp. AEW4]TWD05784.1 AraC family transcriptional regulator with amidase-like domain [Sphingobium sp. AEW010]TWD23337.1 AraC family transcriptional regulator with amidase-like domain [Sphingobium sp. AEW013]TWD25197.1 AraC family transcriptional regulator with amidase-
MPDFALIALPGAYLSSVGAFSDSYLLARDRVDHIYRDQVKGGMETRLRILSIDGGPVMLSDGTSLKADGATDGEVLFGFIWLPAFRVGGLRQLKQRLADNQPLVDWLKRQQQAGAVIGASGAASTLLMAAGLTRGLTVPIARALHPLLRSLFPRQAFDDRLGLGDSGDILIANGLGNDLQLIIRVMERALSPEIARWLRSVVGIDKEEQRLEAAEPSVAQAQLWLEQHFTEPVRMDRLAAIMACSTATVNRRFRAALGMSPKAFQQKLRLETATRMLERTPRSVDRIAELVGYSDSRLFRAMFRRQTGMSPMQWRRQAREDGPAARATPDNGNPA